MTSADIERAYRELADLRASAESADGLVTATVGAHGNLLRLDLDPRVYRVTDADRLSETILATVRAAADSATRQAAREAAVLLPDHADLEGVDLAFDPVLHELDRLIRNGRRGGGNDELEEVVSVVYDLTGHRAFYQDMLVLRDQLADIRGTAESDDGLISATVRGHGLLVALTVDARLFRTTDSTMLATRITATVHRAAEDADAQAAAMAESILATDDLPWSRGVSASTSG